MSFFSPLEQFLLLQDKSSLIMTILMGLPIEFDDDRFCFVATFQTIYDFILYANKFICLTFRITFFIIYT
jgi:hypothetical protein